MIVLLALGLVTAWSVLIPGFLDWDDIVLGVIGSLRLTGPLAAAFAAWVATRRRRAERGRALTAWRAVKAPLAILTVVTGSFTATVLLLALRAALTGQSGPLLPGGLAMSVAGLALYVMVGWILGWLLPAAATPVLAAFGTYALFTWLADGSTWADRLTPATRAPYDLLSGVNEAAFADQTLWLLGLNGALLLGWVALVTRRVLALAAAAIAVLAAGTGAARLVTEPQTMAASERLVYTCQEWPISVCVHPAVRAGLAELAGVFTTLAARLADTPAAFRRVEQHGPGDDTATPGAVVVHIDDVSPGFAQRAATEFLNRLARPCAGNSAAGYRAIVVAWLRGDPLPTGPLPEHRYAAVWFSELTEAQRRDWLRMFYSDFVSCGLQSRHFGGGLRPAEPGGSGYPVNPTAAFGPVYPVAPTPVRTPPMAPPAGFPGATPPAVPGGMPTPRADAIAAAPGPDGDAGTGAGTGTGTGTGTGAGPYPAEGPAAGSGTGPGAGPGAGPGTGYVPVGAPGTAPLPGTGGPGTLPSAAPPAGFPGSAGPGSGPAGAPAGWGPPGATGMRPGARPGTRRPGRWHRRWDGRWDHGWDRRSDRRSDGHLDQQPDRRWDRREEGLRSGSPVPR
ncbi:hypothetical protein JOL79_15510 [Microbispora sp. RL4-1S]|uniref:Uncharacterized protein n=1 Tax=Microbispora oryzae TaxID=2806554 RepID=A0A941AKG4_9ACTN|nr:hypothetical protein [Microbispora oryzae]MBP2705223.1 hypothetical protein [Microbispora oryzae]